MSYDCRQSEDDFGVPSAAALRDGMRKRIAELLAENYRMRAALTKLREHLEYDGGATCDITMMHRIILEGLGES